VRIHLAKRKAPAAPVAGPSRGRDKDGEVVRLRAENARLREENAGLRESHARQRAFLLDTCPAGGIALHEQQVLYLGW
jgi:hypothetical protein